MSPSLRTPIHTRTGLAAVGKLSAKFDLRARARGLTYTHTPPEMCRFCLQKSFCTRDQNFFWLYTRLSCKGVGDLIA